MVFYKEYESVQHMRERESNRRMENTSIIFEEIHHLYRLPNIIRMLRSRRMRWACSSNGRDKRIQRSEKLKERDNLGDLCVDGRIILN
jgi:hypothetical protein